jgi:hypothetical protein
MNNFILHLLNLSLAEIQLETGAANDQQLLQLRQLRASPERPLSSLGASLWYGKHVVSVETFTKPMVKQVMDLALRFEKVENQ